MVEEKDSSKSRLRQRVRKDSSEGAVDKVRSNGSVKLRKERLEKETGEKPGEEVEEESNKIKGDDVAAARGQRSVDNWENLFRVKVEFDGVSAILFVASFLTRTFRLSQPNHIVFDELHYGKYIRMYNEKTFFFDQHPPLGKQLIGAVTNLIGFGNYTFLKIGASYDEVSLDANIPPDLLLIFVFSFLPERANPCHAIHSGIMWESSPLRNLRPLPPNEIQTMDSHSRGSYHYPG